MTRIKSIREKEKKYHESCYENNELFSKGSWLYKPVKTVMDEFSKLNNYTTLKVLDLGCGVGRNSIPMAKELTHEKSKVVCVDLLDLAISKLNTYSKYHGVDHKIESVCSSIEDFHIKENSYDYIVSISALEHVSDKSIFLEKLNEIAKGTKVGGINCFVFNSSVKEVVKETGLVIDPQFEINMSEKEMYDILDDVYKDWSIEKRQSNAYRFDIDRDGIEVDLNSQCITYVVKKNNGNRE